MSDRDELPVIGKAFDLAREMTARTRKLPRDLKFVLGDRMLATAYDVLEFEAGIIDETGRMQADG